MRSFIWMSRGGTVKKWVAITGVLLVEVFLLAILLTGQGYACTQNAVLSGRVIQGAGGGKAAVPSPVKHQVDSRAVKLYGAEGNLPGKTLYLLMAEKGPYPVKGLSSLTPPAVPAEVKNTLAQIADSAGKRQFPWENAARVVGKYVKTLPAPPVSQDPKNCLVLTLDDGYGEGHIRHVLEVTKKLGIKCTFFIIGSQLTACPELWKQALKDGHRVCNHTQDHEMLGKASDDKIRKEIKQWEVSAERALGKEYVAKMKKEFPFFRLPGGSGARNKRILGIIREMGYIHCSWTIDTYYDIIRKHNSRDGKSTLDVSREITGYVIRLARPHSVILLHFNKYDVTGLEDTLNGIRKKGLDFKQLAEEDVP